MRMNGLTHIGSDGRPAMVDVSDKVPTHRVATAEGRLRCAAETLRLARDGQAAKGDVVRTAELAGIMAAKRTSELIPLCHPLPLTKIKVAIDPDEALPGFRVSAQVATNAVTGVEMEALTAVTVACLTLFDMLKAADRTMSIEGVRVIAKTGGKSGSWEAGA